MNSKKWFVLFLVCIVIMSQSFMPITAKAQELNSVGFIDSIEFESTDLYYGQRTKITVKFSEKDNYDLQPGDVLTLTLPQELKGYNKKVSLDDYGVCEISSGIAKCTFNEKVNTHTNIRGKFGIDIQATNVEANQKKEIQTNLGTILDMQTITITGPSSGGGNSDGEEYKGPFSYKVGHIDPENTNEVQWYLMINYNKEDVNKDIKITDSLQGGQKLKKDSFYIVVENSAEHRSLTLKEFESQGYGTIKFVNDSTFNITFNKKKASATRFAVMYNVDITEEGKKLQYLENKYTIEHEVVDHEPVSISEVVQIENITLYGEAEGDSQEKDKEKPQVEGVGEEKETEEPWETTDELQENHPEPETAKEVEEEKLHDAKVEKPQVLGVGEEKETEEPWETTDELQENHPEPETAKKVEEEKLHDAKVEKPQVLGVGEEKETEEPWGTTDELKEERPEPEIAKEVEEEKLHDAKVEQPQVEGVGEEKETEEPWETTDELQENHPEPETAKEVEEEKLHDAKAEKPQVEGVGEEKETEEPWGTTDELKEERPEPETAKEVEEEKLHDAKVEQPQVEGIGKEEETEETWETTDELKENHPEPETAKEVEEEKLHDAKVEQPQVEGVGEEKETEEPWETTDELKENHPEPETAKEVEEEKLHDAKVEKPQVLGVGEEKETEEPWETTDELKEERPELETAKEVEEEKLHDAKVEKQKIEETWEITGELKEERPELETAKEVEEEKLHDPKAGEQGIEETWEITGELKEERPELETAKEAGKEKLHDSKTETPQVEGVGEEIWGITDELEGQPQPERTKLTEETSHQVQEKSKVHGSSKGGGKQLPQTGGNMSYGGHVGGVLFVLGLLMLVVNKRKYNQND
ncbi:collagen binding domain-containing protein [Bacillus cereus group sp. BfR-BA-01430]|uniref:collagen binding domain-containing protein n=2 Tax=unclassified Bacillus cereus group TaxID=2750818 RepID=UPI001F5A6FA8|nr:collagen binding domain-containing protein [Bacillus cereus group sp. BfR-BA-01430]